MSGGSAGRDREAAVPWFGVFLIVMRLHVLLLTSTCFGSCICEVVAAAGGQQSFNRRFSGTTARSDHKPGSPGPWLAGESAAVPGGCAGRAAGLLGHSTARSQRAGIQPGPSVPGAPRQLLPRTGGTGCPLLRLPQPARAHGAFLTLGFEAQSACWQMSCCPNASQTVPGV